MKSKKYLAFLAVSALTLSLTACGASSTSGTKAESTVAGSTAESTAAADKNEAASDVMTIDKEKKEVVMLCEVNGTYFTEPTRHGIVFQGGSNGEKAVLRGLADEKEFYQALLDIGAKAGDNLTAEDMKAKADSGKAVDGDKLNVFISWEGQEEIPFQNIIKSTKDYTMDIRFGGNVESAKEYNTGCVLCLDSCATGITSDAAWPTGTTQNDMAKFYGNKDVLPADGTQVTVTFRLAD